MTPKIQRFDRANGDESTADFFPAIARIAGLIGMDRKDVQKMLLDGQEIATTGYVYRLLPSEAAKVREVVTELAYDRVAMSN